MDMLKNVLSQEVVHKLGWTLLHSLWQGGVVVLLLAILLRVLRKSSANLRYVVACLGLALITLLPVLTFYVVPAPALVPDVESAPSFSVPVTGQLQEVYDADVPLQRAAEYMQMFPAISWRQRAKNFCTSALPYLVFGWFIGVLVLCLWHLGGWVHLQRLRRQKVNLVDESLKGKLRNLAERLKVTRPVEIMESVLVQIPTVVGWLRPMILMPASALAGLSPEQVEALIAHELAHIRRYDYLVNMFQTLVEILGFYHPAVWWISYTIRVERENCCDDLAVSVCGDKVGYARALTSMEEARFSHGELAVAASGGSLSRRIRRLIGASSGENIRFGYVPVVISILLIVALMIPTTLALTAKRENTDSDSTNSITQSDFIETTETHRVITDVVDDYEPWHPPVVDLDETATQAQILFKCKIFEVPADLKFLEGEQKEDEVSRIIWLGKEYADSLEALSRENKNVKVLSAPQVITLDGEEAIVHIGAEIPYVEGYETGEDAGDEPKPIIKKGFAGLELKIKGKTKENGLKLDLNINYGQLKPGFGVHKDDEGREIQVPVIERRECAAVVTVRSDETIVIGGLRSNEKPLSNLILTITPSIVLPEKGPEQAKIETEVRTVDDKPGRLVELPVAEKENIKADQRLAELQSLLIQDQDRKMALEDQALELQQKLYEVQMKLAELETRKTELKSLSVVLASPKEAESERKRATNGEEPRYHTVREGDPVAVLSVVLDDERLDAEKAVIQAEINHLDAQLIEIRKNYEADIFNRESEWRAEMRAFNADVVVAEARIVDTNSVLETDLATLEQMQQEIEIFTIENGANLGTDIVLYNQLQTMKANRDRLAEKIERDKGVLAKYQEELKAAEDREEKYRKFKPYAGTEDEDAQHVIDLAKEALERRMAELKGLSVVLASPKEAESGHERLSAMAAKYAERGDFAKAIEHIEKAIELAKAGKYYGIGIAIEKKDGLIRIGAVLPNTPASGSSFQQGDIIEAVDGVSTEGMSLDDVVARIVGPKGTEVTLSVKSRSQDITEKKTFTRQLLLEGSHVLRAYEWRLAAYKSGKTWPQYRRMMEEQKVQKDGAPRIFAIRYASAEELAEVLNRILERRWKGIKDKTVDVVRIIPHPDTNRLIVIASPADIRLIEALIVELDVLAKQDTVVLKAAPYTEYKQDAAAENTITQVINLKYADCKSVAQILMTLISDMQFRLATDERTNKLIVAGTESTIQQIKDLVAEIDVPVPDKNLEVGEPEKQREKDF